MSLASTSPGENGWKSLDGLVARVDEDRWLSSRYAPERERRALVALYGFAYELARVRLAVSEPALGAIRFQWWRDALEAAVEAPNAPPRHQVMGALMPVLAEEGVTAAALHGLVDGYQDGFEAGDRGLEPEAALARLAAGVLAPGWVPGPAVEDVVADFAAGRRGAAVETGADVGRRMVVPGAVRPALAHLALRHSYRGGGRTSALGKRWVILRAVIGGRV